MAGRGWGKTRVGAEAVHIMAEKYAGKCQSRMLIAGRTAADVRDVMIDGPSGIMATAKPWFRPEYHPSKNTLIYPNGVRVACYGAEKPEKFRGPQYGFMWLDELPHWQNAEASYDQIKFGARHGKDPKMIITSTPLPTPMMREVANNPETRVVRGSTIDNAGNMAASFFTDIYGRHAGTELGAQELDGDLLADVTTAPWLQSDIKRIELSKCPQFVRTIVTIDPAGGSNEKQSNETGITVQAIDDRDNLFLLEDLSGPWSETQWAGIAIDATIRWNADTIGAEGNFGGGMVRFTITHHPDFKNCNAEVKIFTATKGKGERAGPIAAIYKQGRGYHVNNGGIIESGAPRAFTVIEFQMTNYDPRIPRKMLKVSNSPDRMDALVWGGYELLGDGTDTGDIRPSQGSLVVTPDDDVAWESALNEIQGNSEDLW
jgi:phage terminase large subunit-like protein